MRNTSIAALSLLLWSGPAAAAPSDDPYELGDEGSAPRASVPAPPPRPVLKGTCYYLYENLDEMLVKGGSAANSGDKHYRDYVEAGCPSFRGIHQMGAQCARIRGDASERVRRLGLAVKECEAPGACSEADKAQDQAELQTVQRSYGTIRLEAGKTEHKDCLKALKKTPGEVPVLLSKTDGFSFGANAEERAAVMFANKALCREGSFSGYLPAGEYDLHGQAKRVEPRDTSRL